MKIAIIGGGWYGCHIATSLLDLGINVLVFEKRGELFNGASGNTTGRIHRGYHYPRSSKTVEEIQSSLNHFSSKYKDFIFETSRNLYGITASESLIDWGCFVKTIESNKLEIKKLNPEHFGFVNLEGVGSVVESYINTQKAKLYFNEKLSDFVRTNYEVKKEEMFAMKIADEVFDFVINCTFNEIDLIDTKDTILHNSYLFVLKKIKDIDWDSLTLMDGDFFSITPVNENLNEYYLYDVKSQNSYFEQIEDYNHVFENYILPKVTYYFPDFLDFFKYEGVKKSKKEVSASFAAERTLKIKRDKNIITLFPSKINSVCLAEDYIKKIIFEKIAV